MFAGSNTSVANTDGSAPLVVRETVCKTILNRGSISDYTLNCYTGCSHGCVYCYARFMQRFHPHDEAWGKFVDVKINAVEVLKRQLLRLPPGDVFMSSACDGWQPVEAQYGLTRRCCELLLEFGFKINLLTKSNLILRDLDVLAGKKVNVGVSITTLDKRLSQHWEPGVAPPEDRLHVIEEAKKAGLKTTIMFAPLLPVLSDSRDSIESFLKRAADLDADSILVDALNPRPKVWPSVVKLLQMHYPDLRARYSQILFNQKARAEYLARLNDDVVIAAKRLSLTDRLSTCF